MIQLLITAGGTQIDYTKWLIGPTAIPTEKINIPTVMRFSLRPWGADFIVPRQRSYVSLYSTKTDRSLFTGFISAAPVLTYLAKSGIAQTSGGQLFQYDVTCTSDEYLLNVKAVPFIPAYVNRTQGEILISLADTLCPGFFDTTMVGSGDIVPFFEYSPTQSWSEIAKGFADGSRYRVKARDKKLWYVPYGDLALGISYDERQSDATFIPRALDTNILSVPIVNDVTIIGDTEGGNNREDYFLGDGFTANFPLQHKVFRGASSVLLQESWNGADLNTQQWFLTDPGTNFDFTAGALNLVDTLGSLFTLGESYLSMNNGIELAGGIDIQHGEITFNDTCEGVMGGIYTDTSYTTPSLLAGFMVTSPSGIVTSASGAAGVHMEPWFEGASAGDAVISQVNHTYVLQTVVHAPAYSRYTRTYRTLEGVAYGGVENDVRGSITFIVQDFDIAAASGIYYQPKVTHWSVNDVVLPAFAVYALVNNRKLNLTLSNTAVAVTPTGGLAAITGPLGLMVPTGLILPPLPPGSGEYIGPVEVWPGSGSGNILDPPMLLNEDLTLQTLGNSFNLDAAAQITQGSGADTLAFYLQTIPAAGTGVRLNTWEAQAAVSRLQVSGSIADEAFVVGDDGIRSAIITDLNPLPRTSIDCDNAALAFLADRVGTFYNGSYKIQAPWLFNGITADEQYWPTVGRFLDVHAPHRGIDQQKMLVTALTIRLLDMVEEAIEFEVMFGADLYLEKVLKQFVDLQPVAVLTPTDKANPPNPRFTQNVANSFLPDLNNVHIDMATMSDLEVTVDIGDPYFGPIEIRKQDTNWGRGQTSDLINVFTGPQFTLPRQQFDQQWFLRPVSADGVTSRHSKVLRVRWPLRPAAPLYVGQSGSSVQFNFDGDMRNIYGFELRMIKEDGILVLVQKPVTSYSDMTIDVTQTPADQFVTEASTFSLIGLFFNARWVYSDETAVSYQVPIGASGFVIDVPGDVIPIP